MTAFMADVARASLPVAIALLAFTGVARLAIWADDPKAVGLARRYLEPLSSWCLGAIAVHLFAVVAAGDAGALSLLVPSAIGAAAVLLRPSEEPAAAPAPPSPPPAPASEPVPPAPAPSLWVKRAEDGPTREGSLWSR
jgi:hypothetical protein